MVQIQLLNKIIKSRSMDIVFLNDLVSDHFGEYSNEFNFIFDHYQRYGNVPDMATMLDKFPEFDIVDVEESDEYLVDTIREDLKYRLTVPILTKAAEMLKTDSNAAVDYIVSSLSTIGKGDFNVGIDIISNSKLRLDEYLEKKNATTPWMFPTGFKELDDAIGGIAPKEEFIVIVARTNQGKSWVLCKIAEHNWKFGSNIGYISPEMSANAIGYRFDTLNGHFSNFSLYTGKDVDGYEDYLNKISENAKDKFIVATPMDFNKKITVAKLRNFCLSNDVGMLFVDGITYISDERYRKGDNKTTSLTNISEDLMSLSCELKIPIIVVVQANRNGFDENGDVPSLESIRDSDGIAHNATKVLSIRNRDGKLKIEVVKARNCPVGAKLKYDWNIDTGEFEFNSLGDSLDEGTHSSSNNADRYTKRNDNEQPVINQQPLRRKVADDLF